MGIKERIVGKSGDEVMVKLPDIGKAKKIVDKLARKDVKKALDFIKKNDLYPLIDVIPFIETLFIKGEHATAMKLATEFNIEVSTLYYKSIFSKMIDHGKILQLFDCLKEYLPYLGKKETKSLVLKLIDKGYIQDALEWIEIFKLDSEVVKQAIDMLIAKGDYENAIRFVWEFDYLDLNIDLSFLEGIKLPETAEKLLLLIKQQKERR